MDPRGLAERLGSTHTKLLITDKFLLAMSLGAANICESLSLRLITLDGPVGTMPPPVTLEDLLSEGDPSFDSFHLTTQKDLEDNKSMIFRTSGSTGAIKSVLMPHLHWNTNLLTTLLTVPGDTDPDSDVWLAPLSFSYGITAKLHLGLNILLGIPVIITTKPFDRAALSLIDEYKITFLFMTPPLAAEIAKSEVQGTFASIKWLLSAGAPIHAKVRDAIQLKFHGVRLSLEWASTETLLIALQVDDASSLPNSSGTLVNGMEARVVDLHTGDELGCNEQGEILVRSSLCKFAGYLDNAASASNKDFDADGWYHSGDVGYIDENVNVFIVDRVKEFLRVGDGYGTHVAPGELEAVLFDHPAVATAVVVGIRDETTQIEHPTAFIVLQDAYMSTRPASSDATWTDLAKEMEAFVEKRLGRFKRLSGGVYFVDKYPQTGFKIHRRALGKLVSTGKENIRQQRFITSEA